MAKAKAVVHTILVATLAIGVSGVGVYLFTAHPKETLAERAVREAQHYFKAEREEVPATITAFDIIVDESEKALASNWNATQLFEDILTLEKIKSPDDSGAAARGLLYADYRRERKIFDEKFKEYFKFKLGLRARFKGISREDAIAEFQKVQNEFVDYGMFFRRTAARFDSVAKRIDPHLQKEMHQRFLDYSLKRDFKSK